MSEDGWDDGEDWDGNDEEEWDDVTPMASGATAVPQPDLGRPIATPSALPVPENVTITLGSVAAGDSNQVTSQKRSRRVLFRSKEEVCGWNGSRGTGPQRNFSSVVFGQIDMLRRLHKVHLLACFSRLKWLSRPLEDTLLEGLLLSEMPATFSWNVLPSRLTVSNLAAWFHDRFCIDVDGLEGVDYLRDVVTNAASIRPCPVTASQGCQLFVAACRVLGYRCRIVSAIQSIPVSRTIPLTHPSPAKGAGIVMARCLTSAQPAPKPTPKSKSLKRSRTDGDDTKPAPNVPVLVPHSVLKGSLLPPHFTAVERLWAEVCTLSSPLSEGCDGEDEDSLSWSTLVDAIQWLPVDMTRGCVSSEDDFSSLASKSCYVVACEGGSRFTDVTARYCEKFSVIEAARASNSTTAWVPNTLKQLNVRFSEGSDGIHDVIDLTDEPPSWQSVLACICDCIDLQSLALASRNGGMSHIAGGLIARIFVLRVRTLTCAADIPTSLSGFKSHPRYCLQIQLGVSVSLWSTGLSPADFHSVASQAGMRPFFRQLSQLETLKASLCTCANTCNPCTEKMLGDA
jgi:hypothetical protein